MYLWSTPPTRSRRSTSPVSEARVGSCAEGCAASTWRALSAQTRRFGGHGNAWREWAESGDADVWESTTADGLVS